LLNQHGQVLAAEEAALVAVVILAVAAAVLAVSLVAAFAGHRLSGAHTLAAELLAGQVPRLGSIMAVLACRQ